MQEIPPIGTRVHWKQPTEGVISSVRENYFTVLFEGQEDDWAFELEEIESFDVDPPK